VALISWATATANRVCRCRQADDRHKLCSTQFHLHRGQGVSRPSIPHHAQAVETSGWFESPDVGEEMTLQARRSCTPARGTFTIYLLRGYSDREPFVARDVDAQADLFSSSLGQRARSGSVADDFVCVLHQDDERSMARAPNGTIVAPFFRSLFPIESSKGEAQHSAALIVHGIFWSMLVLEDLTRDCALASPVGRTRPKAVGRACIDVLDPKSLRSRLFRSVVPHWSS